MNDVSHIPHSVEAEQQLLGAILIRNETLDAVSDILEPAHFFDPVHRRIYEIAAARIRKGHLVSPVAMRTVLEGDEGLKQLGGGQYLVRMAGASIMPTFARDYAKLIVEQAARRALQEMAAEAASSVSMGADSGDIKSALLQALHALPEASGDESTFSLLRSMTDAVALANEAYQGNASYLKTGLPALDGIVKGLAPGDFMLIGGSTSMGKTSLALEIATNVCLHQHKGVAFVSLEMTRQELATRMAAAKSRVPYTNIRDAGSMEEADFRKFVDAAQEISTAPMRIIPKHIRDIAAIHSAARRAKRELNSAGLHLLVVDYAQLVRGTGKGRYEQMTEVSIALKGLAGMLECPVIGLVQLSRDIGHRDDKRPQLSDIKETGQFENDADQVVFCHREEYWLERAGPRPDAKGNISESARLDWEADLSASRNKMELIVRKNRHGKLATAEIGFHAPTNRFWPLGGRDTMEEF